MKRRSRLTGLLIAPALLTLLATCNCGFGGGQSGGGSKMLKLIFQPGSIQHYKYSYRLNGTYTSLAANLPLQAHVTGSLIWEIASVDVQGVATIMSKEITSDRGTSGLADALTSVSGTFRMASDGRSLGLGPPPSWVSFFVLSPQTVKAGEKWQQTFSQADTAGEGSTRTEATGRLERYESLHGVLAAVITSDLKSRDAGSALADFPGATSGQTVETLANFSTHSTAWLDPQLGRIEKVSLTSMEDLTTGVTGAVPFYLAWTLTGELDRIAV